jgi:hypothetical protein
MGDSAPGAVKVIMNGCRMERPREMLSATKIPGFFYPASINNPYAFGAAPADFAAVAFLVLEVLTLPKDLLKILPFLVLISPLPITNNLKFVVC